MGFTQARASVNEKRVKRAVARSCRHFLPRIFPKTIARTLYEILKRVLGIKLRINVKLLQTRNNERVRYNSLILVVALNWERNRPVCRPLPILVRNRHNRTSHNPDVVHKLNGSSQNLL